MAQNLLNVSRFGEKYPIACTVKLDQSNSEDLKKFESSLPIARVTEQNREIFVETFKRSFLQNIVNSTARVQGPTRNGQRFRFGQSRVLGLSRRLLKRGSLENEQ